MISRMTGEKDGSPAAVALEYTFAREPGSKSVNATNVFLLLVQPVFPTEMEKRLRRLGVGWRDSVLQPS